MKNAHSYTRRDFLKTGSAAALGLATSRLWRPRLAPAAPNDISRVVVVRDDQVNSGSTIHPEIVRTMLDAGLMALTDAPTPAAAWLLLLPGLTATSQVGIKINTINNQLSSHPEVVLPIVQSLAATPLGLENFPENQIIIWDRWEWELEAAGYTINTGASGVRCFGSDRVGYLTSPITVHDSQQRVSRCYTDYSDYLINVSCLKNHIMSGLTGALKNHYGTIDNPAEMHWGYCDPYVPALNRTLFDTCGNRQKLCICDAIFGIRSGGPDGPPQFVYRGIMLSQDPVALDAICREILLENGCQTIGIAHHIDTAAGAPYLLGNNLLANIERIDVLNPSTSVAPGEEALQPAKFKLGQNYPEPFNSATSIPVELNKPGRVHLSVHNLTGQKIRELYQGNLSAGRRIFSWDGRDQFDGLVASGRYLVRLSASGKTQTRLVTLLR